MLSSVQISNLDRPELPALELDLRKPLWYKTVFIDGLAPAAAELSTENYASFDGVYHQYSRVGPRNLVITLDLNTLYGQRDAESLREELYSYLAPKNRVSITFNTVSFNSSRQRITSGVVESFEAPLFVQVPSVQISILCMDPYFVGDAYTKNVLERSAAATVTYNGNVPAWVKLSGLVKRTQTTEYTFSMTHQGTTRSFSVTNDTFYPWTLDFSSMPGDKHVNLSSGGVTNSLLAGIVPGSTWLRLYPGVNQIAITNNGTGGSNATFTLDYTERFVGL